MPQPISLPPELEALLVEHVRAERHGLRVGGLGGAAMMVGIAVVARLALALPARNLWVLATGAAVLMLTLVIPSLLDPAQARPLQLLRANGGGIVWLYVRKQVGRNAGSWVVVGFDDGKSAMAPAKIGQEELVLRSLTQLAPQATVGFSPELAARFKSGPASLRRSG